MSMLTGMHVHWNPGNSLVHVDRTFCGLPLACMPAPLSTAQLSPDFSIDAGPVVIGCVLYKASCWDTDYLY